MKKPILLLHGALGSTAQLDPLKKLLTERGEIVYSLNFSSHGGTSASSKGFGIELFSEEVLTFINHHKLEELNIFGYSMGGYVALWLAHLHPRPIARIVTLGTKFDWSLETAEKEVKKLNPERILEKVPVFAKILEERHAPADWKELMNKTAGMMKGLGNQPLLTPAILKTIPSKVLIGLGDGDDMVDRTYSQEVSQLLPQGSFKLLPNTPHLLEKVNLQAVHTTLNTFFG